MSHPIVRCECGMEANLHSGADVYPHRPDLHDLWFYVCPEDGYRVGCHRGTKWPLGTPASPATQRARREAHAAFDALWRRKMRVNGCSKRHARACGYRWLAEKLGIQARSCHIGMMSRETAERVIELCKPYL